MAKVYIFTNDDLASAYDEEIQNNYLEEEYELRTFIVCEDNSFLMNEEEDTLFIQEYF